MKNFFKKIANLVSEKLGVGEISRMLSLERQLSISRYLNENLYNNPKYTNSSRLNRYEFSIRSQDGGDGIIREIFNRIGFEGKQFVEFGVGDGLQNNIVALLLEGWSGFWFEGDSDRKNFEKVKQNLKYFIEKNRLNVVSAFITSENVQEIFEKNNVPKTLDLLSIDIDGNDYWVWNAIIKWSPRVVVIEYNPNYGPFLSVVPKYNNKYIWQRTHFYGSSISALNKLAREKKYTLVACSFLGNNAFFVRDDLIGDKFDKNLSTEDIFEPSKIFLLQSTKYPTFFVETIEI